MVLLLNNYLAFFPKSSSRRVSRFCRFLLGQNESITVLLSWFLTPTKNLAHSQMGAIIDALICFLQFCTVDDCNVLSTIYLCRKVNCSVGSEKGFGDPVEPMKRAKRPVVRERTGSGVRTFHQTESVKRICPESGQMD